MSCVNDYYSKRTGYVIEGRSFSDADRASKYLMETCGMDSEESCSYIQRLRREFIGRSKKAKQPQYAGMEA